MLDADTMGFLEGGCGLVVASVSAQGEPHASRGWGLTILERDPIVARLLLPIEDATVQEHLRDGGAVALTAGNILTLRSLQLKGRSLGVEPATEDEEARAERYIQHLFDDIMTVDQLPLSTLQGFRPRGYVACTVVLDEVFDQTPGPGAGAPWERAR